jgi:hypothetical protein
MVVTKDATNAPYIHYSGTTAEVLGALKAYPKSAVVQVWYNGSTTSAVVYVSVSP